MGDTLIEGCFFLNLKQLHEMMRRNTHTHITWNTVYIYIYIHYIRITLKVLWIFSVLDCFCEEWFHSKHVGFVGAAPVV